MSQGLSVWGGGYLWVDALAPVSAWEGIPIRVDARTPVGLELANHCRRPKLNLCGKNATGRARRVLEPSWELINTYIVAVPMQHSGGD